MLCVEINMKVTIDTTFVIINIRHIRATFFIRNKSRLNKECDMQ